MVPAVTDDDMYDESRAICRFEISGVFAFFPSIFCIFSGFLYVFWFLIFGETEKPVLTKKTIFFCYTEKPPQPIVQAIILAKNTGATLESKSTFHLSPFSLSMLQVFGQFFTLHVM